MAMMVVMVMVVLVVIVMVGDGENGNNGDDSITLGVMVPIVMMETDVIAMPVNVVIVRYKTLISTQLAC